MNNHFSERIGVISENDFLNFYFLNVDISLTMYNLDLKLYRCIADIAIEGIVSQISDISPGYFFIKYSKNIQKFY